MLKKLIPDKEKLHRIVFKSDTRAGRQFDIILLWSILAGVLIAIIDSVPVLPLWLHQVLYALEWLITIVFTLEYLLRIYLSEKPIKYITSFWGIIDLLSILPTFLSLFLKGTHFLVVIRILRVLRVFRILKLVRLNAEARALMLSLKASLPRIGIFLFAVVVITILLGAIMYVVEGGENGFTSIPQSIYWAIVTITTVGYGDISPVTVLGKFIASIAMIVGYAIIAIPTGIIGVEIARGKEKNSQVCPECSHINDLTARYCSHCGRGLEE